jgi:FAD-dependent urate hydroxylase
LDWYREVLQLPLQNDTRINDITWDPKGRFFRLQADQALYKARFVILSAGIVATGGKTIPALVTQSLPAHIYAHTADDIDFSALANRRVMIIGGGASAFDNAIAALKAGARQVDITIRRPHLPNINRIRWSEWNGFHRHYIDLDAAAKWYYSLEELKLGQLPPPPTYHEAMGDPRLTLFTHAPLQALAYHEGEICGSYGGQTMRHDFLICGTGFECKIWQQAELQSLSSKILLWKDHYQPDPGFENEHLANCPYLGSNLELQPRDAADDYLRRIYCLSTGTSVISGFRANLSSLQFVSPRVCQDISRQLFLEDQDRIRAAFDCYDVTEY